MTALKNASVATFVAFFNGLLWLLFLVCLLRAPICLVFSPAIFFIFYFPFSGSSLIPKKASSSRRADSATNYTSKKDLFLFLFLPPLSLSFSKKKKKNVRLYKKHER